MTNPFNHVALIGCGLIGSSILHGIKKNAPSMRVSVLEKSDILSRVAALNKVDLVSDKASAIIPDADLIIFCVPVGAYEAAAKEIALHVKKGAVISDVGSVKKSALAVLAKNLPDHAVIIGGHPIAGTENSGPEAGFAELFIDRWCILTPKTDDQEAVKKLENLWKSMGSKVATMSDDHHDQVLAMTSHLPHLIAYSIVDTCVKLENTLQQEVIAYSASGFRDFTRIAASDPTMWRDIFLNNREAVLAGLDRFTNDLNALRGAIERGDGQALFDVFTNTRAVRRSIVDQRQHIPEENKKA